MWNKATLRYSTLHSSLSLVSPYTLRQFVSLVGDAVALWLACASPDRIVLVRALAWDIALLSWQLHFILTVPLPTQVNDLNGRYYTEDALSVWTNLGQHSSGLWVSNIKTGTRRISRQDELSFEVRLSRRITKDSSSRRIMRLVPVFILETHNQTNYKC